VTPTPINVFVPTPGLAYLIIDPSAFVGSDGTRDDAGLPGVTGAALTPLLCPLTLPLGSVLREIVLQYLAFVAPPPQVVGYKTVPAELIGFLPLVQLGVSPDPLMHRFTLNETVDGVASYAVGFIPQVAQRHWVLGLRVGYVPPPSGFFPANPIARVLDTRTTGAKLQNTEERVIATGVPPRATGAVITLTVTETEQAGFVAVFRADTTWSGNSSMDWSSSGETIANTVITATDPTGHIRIRGGVNPTHVVIDVPGYFA
jgi:hypothetical protein